MYQRTLTPVKLLLTLIFTISTAFVTPATIAQDLSYLPQSEVHYLQVDDQQYPALLRSWQGTKKLGLAIIVPQLGLGADAAGFTAYLRRQLNSAGWATLAITPPLKPGMPNYATKAEDVANAGEQQLSEQSTRAMPVFTEEQLSLNLEQQQSFLISSMAQLDSLGKQYQGKRILICNGDSAALVIELLKDKKLPMPDMLALINPYSDIPSRNQALPTNLAELTIPVLDIQSRDGTAASLATQQSRITLMPQNQPYRYHQYKMSLDLLHKEGWSNGSKLIEGFAQRINKAYPNG
ncbi:DUF3530 family protein [Shewanella sp. 10N.286.45.A1]|uniref:DUF3530 family protein n=1 Tax=Shewanella sp. 10N.286.45.A1 TaxID=3229694 RepID=UPI00354BE7A6